VVQLILSGFRQFYHPWFTSHQPPLAGFVALRRHIGNADSPPALTTGRREMTEKLLKVE